MIRRGARCDPLTQVGASETANPIYVCCTRNYPYGSLLPSKHILPEFEY
jgi:hypothetical protein